MGTSIFLVALIFTGFLSVIMFILNLPLVYSLALTIIFILFQYLIGPVVVRASTRLKHLRPGENPWLESAAKGLADKSGIPPPRLAIVADNSPNAFVFGRTTKTATLAVHEGLLKNLNKEEVIGVIGHEIGHVKHQDYVVSARALSSCAWNMDGCMDVWRAGEKQG